MNNILHLENQERRTYSIERFEKIFTDLSELRSNLSINLKTNKEVETFELIELLKLYEMRRTNDIALDNGTNRDIAAMKLDKRFAEIIEKLEAISGMIERIGDK